MPLRPQHPKRREPKMAWPRGQGHASSPPRPPEDAATGRPALRLAIGRDGIGLELAEPVDLGCLRVTELSISMPGVRFPVDVSGGVTRFRHRRGQLNLLRVEVAGRAVERWIAPRLQGLVSPGTPDVWIEMGRAKATMCVASFTEAEQAERRPGPIIAFDVHALAEGEDIVFVTSNARGAGLPEPAAVLAMACLEAALGRRTVRSGAVFTMRRPAVALARALLPGAGARVPSTEGVRWTALGADGGTWILHASVGADAATPTEDALRAREAAEMLLDGDEALMRNDPAAARTRYLEALERAPRHHEIAARIVELDAREGGRADAALATLAQLPTRGEEICFGVVPGELRLQVGDIDGALASFESAGDGERAPALGGRAFELAASATRDAETAGRWLDRALARAPRSTTARWARVAARLEVGRLEDAVADVEHLEALARGTRAKYDVWLRAGRTWAAKGLGGHAGAIFERALRYAPDEPEALAGLGAALVDGRRQARGVSLLSRALEISRSRGVPDSPILLKLAMTLAEHLDDLPAAIARAAAIPADAEEAPIARGLEGRWRARLGDLAGAALAFARLRDLAASRSPCADDARARAMVELLLEAAEIERRERRDPLAAQRHLAVALSIDPHHALARRAYRQVGSLVLGFATAEEHDGKQAAARHGDPSRVAGPPSPANPPALGRTLWVDERDAEDPESARRVEDVTRRLAANPADNATFDELAILLESLGRHHEMVALLTGRLEDAAAEDREVLAPRARTILARMMAHAEASGRDDDTALLRDALAAISPA